MVAIMDTCWCETVYMCVWYAHANNGVLCCAVVGGGMVTFALHGTSEVRLLKGHGKFGVLCGDI